MPAVKFTDTFLRTLQPKKAERLEIFDKQRPGLGIRATTSGIHFFFVRRVQGKKVRFDVGQHPSTSLASARKRAEEIIEEIAKGTDPRIAKERERQAQRRRQRHTFGAIVDDYITEHLNTLRTGASIARDLRREFVKVWGSRPITEIDRLDVLDVIKAVRDRGHRHQARNLLAHVRSLFVWAINSGTYGIEHSPCSLIKPSKIVGKPAIRQRILTDVEFRALWKATGPRPPAAKARAKREDDEPLGYPFGDLYRVLALTGGRLDVIASATLSEVDFDKKLLTLSPERMKADAAHVVPLTDRVIEILKGLPRLGEYLFTTTGRRPVSGFSKAKKRADNLMLRELRRGAEHPEKIELTPWVVHDLRRSMRTGLSALGVQDRIAEMTIGHKVQGLHKVYDQHSFLKERRDALERWERHLLGIVEPVPVKPPATAEPIRSAKLVSIRRA